MQQTLVLVKPDGVRKNLIGEIISRFERRGLKVSALKLVKMTEAQAKFHYAEHEGKPFFGELVDFITSGPVAAMVISGENAISTRPDGRYQPAGIRTRFHPRRFRTVYR